MIEHRWLCGWRVASELALPDLLPWRGDNREPELEIRIGVVPDRFPDPVHNGPMLQVGVNGVCRFSVRGVASYLIEDGRRVTVSPELPAEAPDIRVFLLGTVFGILCHQRGLLPLHASCAKVNGQAVAFAGPSGAGKSTLAAALLRSGHQILADDVTVVDTSFPEGPVVLPAFPRLKLWRDTMDSFDLSTEGLEKARASLQKFHLQIEKYFSTERLSLATLYCLEEARDERHVGSDLLRGVAAVRQTHQNVFRGGLARPSTGAGSLLADIGRFCAAVPVVNLRQRRYFDALEQTAATVVSRHRVAA